MVRKNVETTKWVILEAIQNAFFFLKAIPENYFHPQKTPVKTNLDLNI